MAQENHENLSQDNWFLVWNPDLRHPENEAGVLSTWLWCMIPTFWIGLKKALWLRGDQNWNWAVSPKRKEGGVGAV